MRLMGLVLVAVGGLVLGAKGLGIVGAGAPDDGAVNAPVLGGIALVVGLLLLAGGGRRD